MSPEQFTELDRLCLDKLKAVSFGVYNQTANLLDGIRATIGQAQAVSERQRLALYTICYRFRVQLADDALVARTMIAKAELEEEAAGRKPQIRVFRGTSDLFKGGGA